MGRMVRAVAVAALMVLGGWTMTAGAKTAETAWDFTFTSIDGEAMPLSAYRGKALLVVNTEDVNFSRRPEDVDELLKQLRTLSGGTQYYTPRPRG